MFVAASTDGVLRPKSFQLDSIPAMRDFETYLRTAPEVFEHDDSFSVRANFSKAELVAVDGGSYSPVYLGQTPKPCSPPDDVSRGMAPQIQP